MNNKYLEQFARIRHLC